MNRRDFLRASALSGMQAMLGPFGLARHVFGEARRSPEVRPFEWDEATIAQLQTALAAGRETAATLTHKYLHRIAEIDQRGPELKAVLETNPDAMAIARSLDAERKAKGPRGPLHGIPVLVKDNLDTHDRMMTTAGSLALLGSRPARDSFVVERLRAAGAVILGKTNLSEWANFRSSRSSSGWSGRGGQTKNPYALDRNPSGSSSGSGAAVAANLCAVAIGTETDGSIISPSTVNGIVGLKPTVGLVSRAGIIPISASQDTAGPMARTVTDAAILLSAIAGIDPRDQATALSSGKMESDYTKFLRPDGLRGARIGVVRRLFQPGARSEGLMTAVIAAMKEQGAEIIDPTDIPTLGQFGDSEFEVLLYEFKAGLNAYLAQLGPSAPVRTLEEIIAFNEANKAKELPFFGQETFLKAQAKGPLTEPAYLEAVAKNHRLARAEGIDAVMTELRLDALVGPSGGPAGKTDLIYGDRGVGGSSSLAAVAGYPNITVPAGAVAGLPAGISFFGRAFSEPTLLRLAYAFEQATRHRRPPKFLATVG